MRIFRDDDRGYLAWIAGHPQGHVVNTTRRPSARYLLLHRATCGSISAFTNHTGPYAKACATSLDALAAWAAALGGELRACGLCHPRDATAASGPPRGRGQGVRAPATARATWTPWEPGPTVASVDGVTPILASWDAAHHPSQVRLRAYLADVTRRLGSLPAERGALGLSLEVDVGDERRLARHHDLENYLTPLAQSLGADRFSLARAVKRVGGGSRILVSSVRPGAPLDGSWGHFAWSTPSVGAEARFKEGLRGALLAAGQPALPPPPAPAEVHLAWRCGGDRRWASLWKATGDAMGPVLGEPRAERPFDPADDRIVSLGLHRQVDDSLGRRLHVAMWWRPWRDG